MTKTTISLTETKLRQIIKESLKTLLFETNRGVLYHFTSLCHLYSMLRDNTLYANSSAESSYDNGKQFISLSRTNNPKIGYRKSINSVRIGLNADAILSSLRGVKMKPYYWGNPELKARGQFEYEERVYTDIKPLNKYIVSVDVFMTDINTVDYDYCNAINYAYNALANEGVVEPTEKQVNEWFIKHCQEDFGIKLNIINK